MGILQPLTNYEYCKRLHLELLQDLNNDDVKRRFRNIANKLIFDAVHGLEEQEYECVYIHGILSPTKEKTILPQESIDNIAKWRTSFENIFNQVQQLCGVGF